MAAMVATLNVPAIARAEIVPAGCCPVPAAAAAVQILMFLDGVRDVEVDDRAGVLTIDHDATRVSARDLAEELTAVGLDAVVVAPVAA